MNTQAYVHNEADGSYLGFRLTEARKDKLRQIIEAKDGRKFDDESALRVALVRQLGAWTQLRLSWRYIFEQGKVTTYLIVKASKRMTPATAQTIRAALDSLVALTPLTDVSEFQRARSPYNGREYIAEIRQASRQVEFSASTAQRALVAVVPLFFKPTEMDWQGLCGMVQPSAPVTINVLLIPTALSADELAECDRLAQVAGRLYLETQQVYNTVDENAEWAARVYGELPRRLSPAFALVLQVAAPSSETAAAVTKRIAGACIRRDYTLHAPRGLAEENAARNCFVNLEFGSWGKMLVSSKLARLPYITDADGASVLMHVPSDSQHAQVGVQRFQVHGDVVMGNQNNAYFQGASFNNSSFMLNIDSTLTNVSQTIGAMAHADPAIKQQLESLVQQLTDVLKQTPPAAADDAQVVAELTKELVETADKPQPNRKLLEIKGEGLKQAAESLKAVAPVVVMLAGQIVTNILKLGMG